MESKKLWVRRGKNIDGNKRHCWDEKDTFLYMWTINGIRLKIFLSFVCIYLFISHMDLIASTRVAFDVYG